jgi:hypothetical protein
LGFLLRAERRKGVQMSMDGAARNNERSLRRFSTSKAAMRGARVVLPFTWVFQQPTINKLVQFFSFVKERPPSQRTSSNVLAYPNYSF